jgi:hypothetical protein
LLGGCSAAFIISSLMMRYTIMTEKLARRGTHVPTEYIAADPTEIARRDAAAVRHRHFELPVDLGGSRRESKESRKTEIL